jgi:hypothetical protein
MRAITTIVVLGLAATASAQQPPIQNGKVDTRKPAALDREIATIAASAKTDPVWTGWRVPIVDGLRGGCSTWIDSDDGYYFRGQVLDYAPLGATVSAVSRPQQRTAPAGPLPLEGGTGLVVLLRLVDGRLERMQRLADDCPIDAGGRTIHWLDGVAPAESLRVLDGYTREDAFDRLSVSARRSLTRAALDAIAFHRDAGADAILDRIATGTSELRSNALSWLGSRRGAHGFATLTKLLQTEKVSSTRVELVTAIGATNEPNTVATLRGLLKDPDAKVRAAAVYPFAIRGQQAVVPDVTAIVDNDPDNNVRRRAVAGLGRLPPDTAVPLLIQIARTNKNLEVQKQAVSLLTQSKDPRAVAYLEGLLK